MAQKTIKADVIKQRTDTTDNWESKNPILAKGEIGIEETTTGEIKQKVGDGTSAWDKLVYLGLNISTADSKYLQSTNPSYPNTYTNWNTDFLEVSNGKYSLGFDPNFVLAEGGTNDGPCLWSKKKLEDGSESFAELSIVTDDINLYDRDGDLGYTSIHGVYTIDSSDPTDAASKEYVDEHSLVNGGTITGPLNLSYNSSKLSFSVSSSGSNIRAVGADNINNSLDIIAKEVLITSANAGGLVLQDYTTLGGTIQAVTSSLRMGLLQIYATEIYLRGDPARSIKIHGVSNPEASTDAANKQYVDSSIASIPTYTLPIASTTTLGGIKVGDNLSITADGTLSAIQSTYTLPIATDSVLGGVKIGANIITTEDGAISVAPPGISQETADGRYLQLIGGTVIGQIAVRNAANSPMVKLGGATVPTISALLNSGANAPLEIQAAILSLKNGTNNVIIGGVADPTAGTHAANKNYVDSTVASVGNGLPIKNPDNGAMTLNWSSNTTLDMTSNNGYIRFIPGSNVNGNRIDALGSGGGAFGAMTINAIRITFGTGTGDYAPITIGTPVQSYHATTKAYVDSRATSLETSITNLSARSSPVSNITYTDNSPASVALTADESVASPIEVLRYIFSLNIDFSKNLTIEFDIENVSQYSSLFIRHEVNNVGHIINSIGTNSLTLLSTEQNKEISVIDYTITAINETDRHYKLTIIPNDIFKQNPYYIDVYGVKTDL